MDEASFVEEEKLGVALKRQRTVPPASGIAVQSGTFPTTMYENSNPQNSNGRNQAVREHDRCRCQNCHRTSGKVQALDVHRIVPQEHGGSDRLANFVLLCQQCHRPAHGNTEPTEVFSE